MIHFVGAGCGAADLITVRGKALLEQADVIAILPGWGYSTGAQAEMFYAMRQGKKTVFLERAGTEKETEKEKQEKYPQ